MKSSLFPVPGFSCQWPYRRWIPEKCFNPRGHQGRLYWNHGRLANDTACYERRRTPHRSGMPRQKIQRQLSLKWSDGCDVFALLECVEAFWSGWRERADECVGHRRYHRSYTIQVESKCVIHDNKLLKNTYWSKSWKSVLLVHLTGPDFCTPETGQPHASFTARFPLVLSRRWCSSLPLWIRIPSWYPQTNQAQFCEGRSCRWCWLHVWWMLLGRSPKNHW